MKWVRGAVRSAAFSMSLGLVAGLAVAAPGDTTRVSVSSIGAQANARSEVGPVSADGRFVAFWSYASNLVVGDTNAAADVFVHDRQTGSTTLVSVAATGGAANGDSWYPQISADGRFVAFWSNASNLVVGDTNAAADVLVHDRQTGSTTLVSDAATGGPGNADSYGPHISADGRFVAFGSNASNLVVGDSNAAADVFVHDRQAGRTTLVSVAATGGAANADSIEPSISSDGRFVAFGSGASNLVVADTNAATDVFVHDRQAGRTTLVSVTATGGVANGDSHSPQISADGRFVAFVSYAGNLVVGDTNAAADVFVHDRQTRSTTVASVAATGGAVNGNSLSPRISADGRFVAFWSNASNLVDGDTNAAADVFVHDRQTGSTTLVSDVATGGVANGDSWYPHISAFGRYVAFDSNASNLVANDTNGTWDVFVHELDVTTEPYVLFLPGITGSRLWQTDSSPDGNKLWVANRDQDLCLLRPDEDGRVGQSIYTKPRNPADESQSGPTATILDDWPLLQKVVYQDLFNFFDRLQNVDHVIWGWEAVPYDWRKSVEDVVDTNAANSERGFTLCDPVATVCTPSYNIVGRLKRLRALGYPPVTIIGHSNGGLLAKALIRELESDPDIGSARVQQYVERVILVASPQLGTPKALEALLHGNFLPILSEVGFRETAEVMPGAYGLLPGRRYLQIGDPDLSTLVQFDPTIALAGGNWGAFAQLYGSSLGAASQTSYRGFLNGTIDGRLEPVVDRDLSDGRNDCLGAYDPYALPNRLRENLLSSAWDLHERLDSWRPPTGVGVVQIAGVGVADTPTGIRYQYDSYSGAVWWSSVVSARGDGTVVTPSAAGTVGDTLYVDLGSYNRCRTQAIGIPQECSSVPPDDLEREHMNIMGTSVVQQVILNYLTNDWSGRVPFVSGTEPGRTPPQVISLPDLTGDGRAEIAVLRPASNRVEISNGATTARIRTLNFFSGWYDETVLGGFTGLTVASLPDMDGNGVPEIALLAAQQTVWNGKAVVEVRNADGSGTPRKIGFTAGYRPRGMAIISGDADRNGSPELAILMVRASDGQGYVEVRNAFGTADASQVWVGAARSPIDIEALPDTDGDGVPEVAVLSARDRDGRIGVEVKNVIGVPNRRSIWFMDGNTAIDLTTVNDADANSIPEVAVLSRRNSDGRLVVELKNAYGAVGPSTVWFAAGHSGLAVEGLGDADGNGVPEVAVLSKRDSDGRFLLEVKNATGILNSRAYSYWYPAGFVARDLAIVPDLNNNGIIDAAALLLRGTDGRTAVQVRDASGSQTAWYYWFTP